MVLKDRQTIDVCALVPKRDRAAGGIHYALVPKRDRAAGGIHYLILAM